MCFFFFFKSDTIEFCLHIQCRFTDARLTMTTTLTVYGKGNWFWNKKNRDVRWKEKGFSFFYGFFFCRKFQLSSNTYYIYKMGGGAYDPMKYSTTGPYVTIFSSSFYLFLISISFPLTPPPPLPTPHTKFKCINNCPM